MSESHPWLAWLFVAIIFVIAISIVVGVVKLMLYLAARGETPKKIPPDSERKS